MKNEITVKQGNHVVPFSRGILTRSLVQLGLDATQAYDIATKIYRDLHELHINELSTQHLARVLSERIRKHAGDEIGQRYEKTRLFKRSSRPLVLLVGGATGSGKSTVATEVAHRLDITRIQSTDSVRHIMRSMISERLLPAIHHSSFEGLETEPWTLNESSDPRISGLLEQTRHVSVAVRAVLDRAVQENLSTIIEGVHLIPGLFQEFAAEPRIQFMHMIVSVHDEAEHRNRFLSRGRTSSRSGQRYLDNFDSIRAIQDFLLQRATAEGVPIVENQDVNKSIHEVLGTILDAVGDSSPVQFEPQTP